MATGKSAATRHAILEAAVDRLAIDGFHRLTLTGIASAAAVTRGCLKYYFGSLDALILALAPHVGWALWTNYVALHAAGSRQSDPIATAVALVGAEDRDRHRIARMELVVASRTMPALAAALHETADAIDREKCALVDHMFGEPGLSNQTNFRAARDLAQLIDDWLFVEVFAGDGEERRKGVLQALRLALYTIWKAPAGSLDATAPKVRLRVPATRDAA